MHVTDSAASAVTNLHKYRQATQRGMLIIASLFGMANVAIAGTNTWTALGPSGGTVYDLAFHPTEPATMYAATSAGFYRSSDSGSSWQHTSADGLGLHFNPTSLAVDASRPDRVLISSGPGFALYSRDRGLTLQVTNGHVPTGGGPIAAATDGSAIYYAVEGDVYRSTDGGASRQLRGSPFGSLIYTLRIDPTNAQIVYATNYFAGIHRSTDGGANWTNIYTPVNDDGVWTMAIDPQNASRFWLGTNGSVRVSADAGATWQTVLSSTAYDIDVDARNAQFVYVTTLDGKVMRTTNGGTTWTQMSLPAKSDASGQRRLAIHPADSAHLYLFGAGIFESLDAGATWVQRDNGILATSPRRFSPTPTASGHFFVPVIGYGVAGVRPGDNRLEYSFTPMRPGAGGGPPPDVTAVLSLPSRLIAAFSDSRVAISSDLGATWTMATADPPAPTYSLAVANGGAMIYAATDEGLYRSEDYGDHWSLSGNGLPADADVAFVAVAANQTSLYATVAVGTAGYSVIYRSLDGGQSWSLTPTVLEKRFVSTMTPHPTDAQTLLVGTNEGVFKTTDGGSTWQTMELYPGVLDGSVSAIAFDPTNPNIIYFDAPSSVGHVHRSVDGGATFQKITPDYYEGDGSVSLLVAPDRPHLVLAAVPGGGVREISIEPDLHLSMSTASDTVTPNSPVEFTITATNRGPFDATGVQVEAQLPTGATGISAASSDSTCAIANNVVTCTTAIVRFNQATVIRVSATPATEGSFAVSARVTGLQPDSATANNSASRSVSVSRPASRSGGGGGGGFDAMIVIGLLSIGLLRRRRRLYE